MTEYRVKCEIEFQKVLAPNGKYKLVNHKVYFVKASSINSAVKKAMKELNEEIGKHNLANTVIVCETVATKYIYE